MNLKQMVSRVMRALPHMPPGAMGEPDIVDMLNQGQLHLSRASSKLVVWEHSLTANYNIVPFPSDLLTISSVFWVSASVERELSPAGGKIPLGIEDPVTLAIATTSGSTYSDSSDSTEPTRYYTKGGRIMIYPLPKVAGTVSIAYIPKPTEMTEDDDTPDMEGSENYLIAFALHRLHLEAGSSLSQVWEAEKNKEEYAYMQTTDQNYRTPFQVEARW